MAADVGDQLQAVVTAGNQFGSATVTAAAVGPVASGAPRNTVAPRISGTPEQGQVLNVNSTWNPAGTSYTYQWQRSPDGHHLGEHRRRDQLELRARSAPTRAAASARLSPPPTPTAR